MRASKLAAYRCRDHHGIPHFVFQHLRLANTSGNRSQTVGY